MKLTLKHHNLELRLETNNAEDCVKVLKEGVAHLFNLDTTDVVKVDEATVEALEEAYQEEYEEVRKRLVFMKCNHCGEVTCKMLDLETTTKVDCRCGKHIYINDTKLYHGYYNCDCGGQGSFLMTTDVDKVRCVECKKNMYMVKDPEKNCYKGTSF